MAIEKFILEQAVQNVNLGLKAYLFFQSYTEDKTQPYYHRALDFYSVLEGALVNGDVPLKYL